MVVGCVILFTFLALAPPSRKIELTLTFYFEHCDHFLKQNKTFFCKKYFAEISNYVTQSKRHIEKVKRHIEKVSMFVQITRLCFKASNLKVSIVMRLHKNDHDQHFYCIIRYLVWLSGELDFAKCFYRMKFSKSNRVVLIWRK